MKPKTQEEMLKLVHVTAQLTAKWNGVEHDLSKGTDIATGVVEHWQSLHPDVAFKIEEIPQTPIPSRDVQNPLEENDRGEAFAGLKRGRPKKDGE